MVEQKNTLNAVFRSLSDPTRRDILKKISKKSLSVGEIATHYNLTFAAVAKHLEVLHRAKLISKSRRGKQQIASISPNALATANAYLENYRDLWESVANNLDKYLKIINKSAKGGSASGGKGTNHGTN